MFILDPHSGESWKVGADVSKKVYNLETKRRDLQSELDKTVNADASVVDLEWKLGVAKYKKLAMEASKDVRFFNYHGFC